MNGGDMPPVESLFARCQRANARDIWSAQTYICLKQRGLNVHLVPNYIPGKICVVPYDYLHIKYLPIHSYVVAIRYDIARPEVCEQRIVLNQSGVLDEKDHFVPHWPQPNLKPRNLSRGARVENMVHKGQPGALAEPFKTEEFLNTLKDMGIHFAPSVGHVESMYEEWRDYTEADVVLAIRNNTEYDLTLKPPLKLINSWFAGCPALLGPEPAYQALRESELDYIEIRSPEDAIAALQRLQDNPELYLAMVENGFRRAQAYTVDNTAALWRDILANSIASDYERWRHQSPFEKAIGRPVKFVQRVIKHKRELKDYYYKVFNGPRLFSDPAFRY